MPQEKGLTSAEARARLSKYGFNSLPQKPRPSDFSIFISQLKSPLVYILIAAGVITFFLYEFADTAIISLAVFINTILGFIQERKAERAFEAMQKLLEPHAKVVRDGKLAQVDAKEVVPGDLVILAAGDKIPGDGKLIEASRLFVAEAILTGESEPVEKKVGGEVFMGTVVTAGTGRFLIERTGAETKMGKIAQKVQTIDDETPLRKELKRFSKQLSIIVFLLTLLVFIVGILTERAILEVFTTSVALAVSAIPEGLLVGLTVVLAIGMQRILKKKGLVRSLLSAETLGGVTTICIDKTGTLTQGEMKVVETFGDEGKLAIQAIVANDLDDPTVIALFDWAEKGGKLNKDIEGIKSSYKRLDSIPFSSKTRYFASLNRDENNNILFVNGAPEVLLAISDANENEKTELLKSVDDMTESGLRVIGMARKMVSESVTKIKDNDLGDLEYVGLLGLTDPVRKGVEEALIKTQKAGIDLVVITGDYPVTAVRVMKTLGIEVDKEHVIDGEGLDKISKSDLATLLKTDQVKLFARTTPDQKIRIVDALQENGEVVAMMGDGVNDAPALRSADIGIVVGEATEVAKETSDLVLLDSNYETILSAIEEGRGIFDNIRKIILYLLSDAFQAIVVVFGSIILNLPLPVTAAQILWINLISDGFPNLALTVDPKSDDIMDRPPRDAKESITPSWIKLMIFVVSAIGGTLSLLLYIYVFTQTQDLELARSITFLSLGANTLFYVFSVRTLTLPFWKENLFNNRWLNIAVVGGVLLQVLPFAVPGLGAFLGVKFPGLVLVITALGIGIITFIMIEITKAIVRRHLSWFQH